ncbi:MAG: hypothetical protein U9Q77_02110 [Candidatus Marinimicrobia bacterium]|nr:hypothetical protein [Candidatus Neomarinimicrobiota bacterium]
MQPSHEKMMRDIHRIIDKERPKTEAEMNALMDRINSGEYPVIEDDELSIAQQAEDLVSEAYEYHPREGRRKALEAIKLDPDCIAGYEYLGLNEISSSKAKGYYKRGINIGRRIFGGEFLEDNRGYFWGIHETRPFMRCLQYYSDCLYTARQIRECVTIQEELIDLNPNDNQGVRDLLLLYLIQLGDIEKFNKYADLFPEDIGAYALFNRALLAFKTEGDSEIANAKLQEAVMENPHVSKKILSHKPVKGLAEHYGLGSEEEADYYAMYARHVWRNTRGAVKWLLKHQGK